MIQSMTGFAECTRSRPTFRLKISIKSLNHRFFDWTYKGTPLGEVENRLRLLCQRKVQRGRLEVFLEAVFLDPEAWKFSVNEALLEKIFSSLERVSRRLGRPLEVSLDALLRLPQLVELGRKELKPEEAACIETCFEKTLEEVLRQRRREGLETARQIRTHIMNIRKAVARVERMFRRQPVLIQAKLRKKLEGLNHNSMSEERLSEESAFLAQRYDLAEEIGRLKSHLGAMEDLLSARAGEPAGKKLDFLAQELYREANTSGSKSTDIEIIRESLAIKTEVESIRQHVQNIE